MIGPTRALIDLDALRGNLNRAQRASPAARVMAVIKADGYGHGIIRVAEALSAADAFAVARVGEAETLRLAGCDKPIVVLSGCQSENEWLLADSLELQPVVHHLGQVDFLDQTDLELKLAVCWLKLNTGMNRLGVDPGDANDVYSRLRANPLVDEVRWMTHFACADEPDRAVTHSQIACFSELTADHSGAKSLANSAGLLAYPQAHADWVRPGIMLYGASPFLDRLAADEGLKPVMSLHSRVISVRTVQVGGFVGYGATWQALKETRVAIVGVGYGDGYPRQAEIGTPVRIAGRNFPLIGRVSMDSIAVDVTELDSIAVGDEVTLWGKGLPVDTIASCCGSIAYHLLCGVTARVPRLYTDAGLQKDS